LEDAYDGGIFEQEIAEVAQRQESLRRAWSFQTGVPSDLARVEDEIGWNTFDLEESHFKVGLFPGQRYDEIDLTTDDLWKFISYLFLRDFLAGKIGICGNPDCLTRYYLKSRSDQKFCQSGKGECTAYAQRQYALKWWHEKKQGKKAKKGTKSPRRKRQ
jgi:hypothetical protein